MVIEIALVGISHSLRGFCFGRISVYIAKYMSEYTFITSCAYCLTNKRQSNLFQTVTALECTRANALYAIGDNHRHNPAISKRRRLDRRHRQILIGCRNDELGVGTGTHTAHAIALLVAVQGVGNALTETVTAAVHALSILKNMIRGQDLLLRHKNDLADLAVRTVGQTRSGAGRLIPGIGHSLVAGRQQYRLGDQDLAASGALLAVGHTVLSTGGGLADHNRFSVPLSGENGLRHGDLTANGTVRALRQTCLGTGGLPGGIQHLGMTFSRQNSLLHRDRAADRALGTLGQSALGTGCLDGG